MGPSVANSHVCLRLLERMNKNMPCSHSEHFVLYVIVCDCVLALRDAEDDVGP